MSKSKLTMSQLYLDDCAADSNIIKEMIDIFENDWNLVVDVSTNYESPNKEFEKTLHTRHQQRLQVKQRA
jgi:hypothetical protein